MVSLLRSFPWVADPQALFVGVFYLVGGFVAVRMIPDPPVWFVVLDLAVAYLPMAWSGARLANR